MSSGFVNDPHSELGNSCPRNQFNIVDDAELQPIEAGYAAKRAYQLELQGMKGKFDIPHLKSIHKNLFPWAGEFRVVNISEGNTNFGPAMHIVGALTELFDRLAKEKLLVGLAAPAFPEREFIRQLALDAGHPLSWSVVETGLTQHQMIDASIASHTRGDNSGFAAMIEAGLFSTRGREDE